MKDFFGRLRAQAAAHLADYPDSHFVCVVGPSGAGKGTAGEQFLQLMPEFHVPVSVTTRGPRDYEKHGVHYHFITMGEFEELVDTGQIMTGDGYAGSNSYYADYWPEPGEKRILLEITLRAALYLKSLFPDKVTIFFIHPTGLDESAHRQFLTDRLMGRGTEPPEKIAERVDEGIKEIATAAAQPPGTLIRIYNYETPNTVQTMIDFLCSRGILQEQ